MDSDKVSDLPTFILHRILSFLRRKEAARTSLLSKRWKCIWDSFPKFEIDIRDYINIKEVSYNKYKKKVGDLMDFVDESLQRFIQKFIQNKLQIERFHFALIIPDDSNLVSLIDSWIELVLYSGVRELFLMVNIGKRASKIYNLPEKMFHGKSINGTYSKFYSLQNLQLYHIYITENHIRDVIRYCPNINYFVLGNCRGLKSLEISNLGKLEYMKVEVPAGGDELDQRVKIDAPNLKRFSLESSESYLPCEIDLTSCHDLRELKLVKCGLSDDVFHLHVSSFPLLECLEINDCNMLRRIRVSAQRLKRLCIGGRDEIEMIEIDAPNLSSFEYTAYNVSVPLLHLNNVPCPMGIVCKFDKYNDLIDNSWFLKLRKFLGVSTRIKYLKVDFTRTQVSFDLEKLLREVAIPPVVEVDNLVLTFSATRKSIDCASVMEGLLWSCHPKTISISSFSLFQEMCRKAILDFSLFGSAATLPALIQPPHESWPNSEF